jgi:hypothetical protein
MKSGIAFKQHSYTKWLAWDAIESICMDQDKEGHPMVRIQVGGSSEEIFIYGDTDENKGLIASLQAVIEKTLVDQAAYAD